MTLKQHTALTVVLLVALFWSAIFVMVRADLRPHRASCESGCWKEPCDVGKFLTGDGKCKTPFATGVTEFIDNSRGRPSNQVIHDSINLDDLDRAAADIVRWSGTCKPGQFPTYAGGCGWPEPTEFVPDLPERMLEDSGDLFLTVSNEPTSLELVLYTPPQELYIAKGDWMKCMYYDGHQVAFLVYADGQSEPVPCAAPK
jgi:hypothetical protein